MGIVVRMFVNCRGWGGRWREFGVSVGDNVDTFLVHRPGKGTIDRF